MTAQEKKYYHALQIIPDNCTGCTACVRVCPTEAIRVRNGKVKIDPNRCVDCGNCINTCRFHAILPKSDGLEIIKNYKYTVAILSSSYAGQFTEDIAY